MTTRNLLAILIIATAITPQVSAESIGGIFSDRAGTDSLEICAVLRDIEPGHAFGNIQTVGDITGDGKVEVLAIRHESSYGYPTESFLFHGGGSSIGNFLSGFSDFKCHVDEVGDINDDGFIDLAGYLLYPTRQAFYFGGPALDDQPDWIVPDRASMVAVCTDLNTDGYRDIPVSNSIVGGYVDIVSFESPLTAVTLSDGDYHFGSNLAVGEFNGDEYDDLVVMAAIHRVPAVMSFYWGGPDFDTIPDFVIEIPHVHAGFELAPLKDFNGDGYGDLLVSGVDYDHWGIYFGGPMLDTRVDARFPSYYFNGPLVEAVGDINNDGLDDIVAAYSRVNHHEPASSIAIYLGGEVSSELLTPDVRLDGFDIPGLQTFTQGHVNGIGDFNGDGINDFAISAMIRDANRLDWGTVNIFAGWRKSVTDVPYDFKPTLPDNYELTQNYPNPFNPTTTIQFALPGAGRTELAVYNILGERVTTLLNNHLAAGTYTISWDGTNTEGGAVASGVYVYRLQSGDYVTSRKMVLAK